MKMGLALTVAALVGGAVTAASHDAVVVRRVVLTPDTLRLSVGDSGQARCAVYGNKSTPLANACSFRLVDGTVGRLAGAGQLATVIGAKAGQTKLIASVANRADTSTVVVTGTTGLTVVGIYVRPESVVVDTGKQVQFCSAVRMSDDSVRLVDESKPVAACDSVFRDLATYTTSSAWQAGHDTVHVAVDQEPVRELGPDGLGPVRFMVHSRILDAIRRPDGEWVPVRPVRGGRLVT